MKVSRAKQEIDVVFTKGERVLLAPRTAVPSAELHGESRAFSSSAENDAVLLACDPHWQLAQRITASRGFVKARLLSQFLLHICRKTLLGQTSQLTEQQIGETVFRRREGYSPGEDNIVRNYARLLRTRLAEYFETEGATEDLRIAVPRGGYVPLFLSAEQTVEARPSAAAEDGPEPAIALSPVPQHDAPTPAESASRRRAHWLWPAVCAVLLTAFGTVSVAWLRARATPVTRHPFWAAFFNAGRDTVVVPADSGLVLYENLTGRRIPLAEYAGGEYQKHTVSSSGISSAVVNELGSRRYTSVVDVHLVSLLSQRPEVVSSRFKVRYAREVTLDDLKQSNVVLLGSIGSNPWVELYQGQQDFRFEGDGPTGEIYIHNLHPLPGEASIYRTDKSDPAHTTYGLVAEVPNLDGTGHVLLIEGINMAGTEAAAEFLFGAAAEPLLREVTDAHGALRPFQVLVRTSNIGANAPNPTVVATRLGAPFRRPS